MVVNNPFMTKEEYFRSETYNGAIILPVLGNPLISLSLPNGYDGLAFVEGRQKCGMMIVNLILTDTIISGNKIQLAPGQTSGKARFRIYPNIEPLKEWVQLAFTATKTTGTVTCDMFKGGDHEEPGTELVKANLINPEDLSDEDIGLEYVDFEFTLTEVSGNRPTLDTVSVKIEVGSSIPLLDIEFLKLAELINYTPADVLAKLLTVDGVNSGLNADKLDNQEGSYYLPASSYTAADVLNKLKTVHGPGSGLSADLFDNLDSSKFMYQHTDLGAATNLNSITVTGLYHQPSSANAQGGSNYPVGMAGLLQVFASGSMIYQYYTVYDQDHQVYVRTCYNGTWFNWNKILDDKHSVNADTFDSLDSSNFMYVQTTNIPAAADLNTYTTTGIYHQDSATSASTGLNYPENVRGVLEIIKISDALIYQRFTTYANIIYARTYWAGTWSAWAKVFTSGNDGAGSGFDSDLLDGQHGSYYGKASDKRSGWVLVETKTIASGSPVSSVTFSGLDGDSDGKYLLDIDFITATNSNSRFMIIAFNNDRTDLNVRGYITGDNISLLKSDVGNLAGVNDGQSGCIGGSIELTDVNRSNTNNMHGKVDLMRKGGTDAPGNYSGGLGYALSANLTSITLGISAGNFYGKIKLYKWVD